MPLPRADAVPAALRLPVLLRVAAASVSLPRAEAEGDPVDAAEALAPPLEDEVAVVAREGVGSSVPRAEAEGELDADDGAVKKAEPLDDAVRRAVAIPSPLLDPEALPTAALTLLCRDAAPIAEAMARAEAVPAPRDAEAAAEALTLPDAVAQEVGTVDALPLPLPCCCDGEPLAVPDALCRPVPVRKPLEVEERVQTIFEEDGDPVGEEIGGGVAHAVAVTEAETVAVAPRDALLGAVALELLVALREVRGVRDEL